MCTGKATDTHPHPHTNQSQTRCCKGNRTQGPKMLKSHRGRWCRYRAVKVTAHSCQDFSDNPASLALGTNPCVYTHKQEIHSHKTALSGGGQQRNRLQMAPSASAALPKWACTPSYHKCASQKEQEALRRPRCPVRPPGSQAPLCTPSPWAGWLLAWPQTLVWRSRQPTCDQGPEA